MRYEGMVTGVRGAWAVVKAVQGDRVVGQSELNSHGRWELDLTTTPTQIVIAAGRGGIYAVSAPIDRAGSLAIPETFPVVFRSRDSLMAEAVLTLDPMELSGFPSGLLWVLRTSSYAIVDLHLVEVQAVGQAILRLQKGSYQLSGGIVGIHPGESSWRVAEVVDRSGVRTGAHNGTVKLEIDTDMQYDVVLSTC
jgi:hypothetical protein